MPSISLHAEAQCRLPPAEVCAWIDRQPVDHREPGPGEVAVELLERTGTLYVYRIRQAGRWESIRRVRTAPNRWTSERTAEIRGYGRFRIRESLKVDPDGPHCRLTQVTEAVPLNRGGRLSSWIARASMRRLQEGASGTLAHIVEEVEAESGLAALPIPAARRMNDEPHRWFRRRGVRSRFSPTHDWSAAGVISAGVVGSIVAGILLVVGAARIAPGNGDATAIAIAGAFALFIGAMAVLGYSFDQWRVVERLDADREGVSLQLRRGGSIDVPWGDFGLWALRSTDNQIEIRFRHARMGDDCRIWLRQDHARVLVTSPYCPPVKPATVVRSILASAPGVGP